MRKAMALVLALVMAGSLLACGGGSWKKFEGKGYTIDVGKDWAFEDNESSISDVASYTYYPNGKPATGEAKPWVLIMEFQMSYYKDMSPEEQEAKLLEYYVDNEQTLGTNHVVEKYSNIQKGRFGNYPYVRATEHSTVTDNNTKEQYSYTAVSIRFFSADDTVIYICCSAHDDVWSTIESDFNHVLDSVKLK